MGFNTKEDIWKQFFHFLKTAAPMDTGLEEMQKKLLEGFDDPYSYEQKETPKVTVSPDKPIETDLPKPPEFSMPSKIEVEEDDEEFLKFMKFVEEQKKQKEEAETKREEEIPVEIEQKPESVEETQPEETVDVEEETIESHPIPNEIRENLANLPGAMVEDYIASGEFEETKYPYGMFFWEFEASPVAEGISPVYTADVVYATRKGTPAIDVFNTKGKSYLKVFRDLKDFLDEKLFEQAKVRHEQEEYEWFMKEDEYQEPESEETKKEKAERQRMLKSIEKEEEEEDWEEEKEATLHLLTSLTKLANILDSQNKHDDASLVDQIINKIANIDERINRAVIRMAQRDARVAKLNNFKDPDEWLVTKDKEHFGWNQERFDLYVSEFYKNWDLL